jgi:DNA-binding response OmpR family regulator
MTGAVLIVDDSLTVRMDLAAAFEAAGFRPVLCATVAEARSALLRERVVLAVLDVVLPDGDGVELLAEIRTASASATIPVLLLSTEAEVKDRIRGLTTGADDYVGKPYDVGYVLARASELVRERAGQKVPGRATILLIDDSPTFREEVREALAGAGYAVLMAETGEEGLRMAASERPTAIVVDSVMTGIDGVTFIRKIRLDAALRGTPCILLTGSEDHGAEPRALDAGADAFVRKDDDLEIILARLAAVLRSAGTRPEEGTTLLGAKRVLAVDDSLDYLHELSALLRGEGYDVVPARSGEEAIEMLAVQSVDCILLDLLMPGIDGQETCRRIKASSAVRDIPLIMLSAMESRSAMIDSLGAGADDFIPKSSEFEVLKARVRAQLRRKQFEDEHRKVREKLLHSELDASEERAGRRLAEAKATLVEELERKNKELEAFSYSVSHDLRAPLRSIDGFSRLLLEDYGPKLDDTGRNHLTRVRAAAQRMGELIDDLLDLSRVSRAELSRSRVSLSDVARTLADEISHRQPERKVAFVIAEGLVVDADSRLLRVLLDNLLGNAWKFTSKVAEPRIEVGSEKGEEGTEYFVRDNGAGFNMSYAQKLFSPFQRLHNEAEFPGTGIGLATVQRICDRHGGRVWAEGVVGEGATIHFTIAAARGRGRQ